VRNVLAVRRAAVAGRVVSPWRVRAAAGGMRAADGRADAALRSLPGPLRQRQHGIYVDVHPGRQRQRHVHAVGRRRAAGRRARVGRLRPGQVSWLRHGQGLGRHCADRPGLADRRACRALPARRAGLLESGAPDLALRGAAACPGSARSRRHACGVLAHLRKRPARRALGRTGRRGAGRAGASVARFYLGGYSLAKIVPGGNLTLLAASAAQSGGRLQATFRLLLPGSAAALLAAPLDALAAGAALTDAGALVPHKGEQARAQRCAGSRWGPPMRQLRSRRAGRPLAPPVGRQPRSVSARARTTPPRQEHVRRAGERVDAGPGWQPGGRARGRAGGRARGRVRPGGRRGRAGAGRGGRCGRGGARPRLPARPAAACFKPPPRRPQTLACPPPPRKRAGYSCRRARRRGWRLKSPCGGAPGSP